MEKATFYSACVAKTNGSRCDGSAVQSPSSPKRKCAPLVEATENELMTVTASAAFDAAKYPRKLNLGCGFDVRQGYLNVDMNAWHKPDVVADIRDLGFLPGQYYDEILAQDVLEHLPRTDTLKVLAHWNRPLKIGGKIILRVPSVLGVADLLRKPDNQAIPTQEQLIQCLFGTQAYTGDFHFTSFTPLLLDHYLKSAGYATEKTATIDGWLLDVVARKAMHIEGPPIRDFSGLLSTSSDEEFVHACYREILQREADPGGLSYYLDALRGGKMSRKAVIDLMVSSSEYLALQARQRDSADK